MRPFESAADEMVRMLERHGVPKDRAALVRRNVELRAKLRAVLEYADTIMSGFHEAHNHAVTFAECQESACGPHHELMRLFRDGV